MVWKHETFECTLRRLDMSKIVTSKCIFEFFTFAFAFKLKKIWEFTEYIKRESGFSILNFTKSFKTHKDNL